MSIINHKPFKDWTTKDIENCFNYLNQLLSENAELKNTINIAHVTQQPVEALSHLGAEQERDRIMEQIKKQTKLGRKID